MVAPEFDYAQFTFLPLGLLFAWLVATSGIDRVAVERYGPEVGADVGRVARPFVALLLVAGQMLAGLPVLGSVLLAIAVALGERSSRAHGATRIAREQADEAAERIARRERGER